MMLNILDIMEKTQPFNLFMVIDKLHVFSF